jgi:glycosyltransferase involved in cell wall biosynthesis
MHKDSALGVAVASAAYQCLGSGCPILVHDVNFFETLKDEVLKYGDFKALSDKLESVFQEKGEVKQTIQKALAYAEANSGQEIANRFLHLFESLH